MMELCNVTKKYGDTVVLDRASYTFPQQGLVCLMGASGGGKTTLLNLLAGFDTDYTGEIRMGDVELHELDTDELCRYRRDNVGFVFQSYNLLPGYSALENVCLAAPGEVTREKEAKGVSLLKRLGLEDKQDQKAETLSGGQKQRVAIARALMGDPQIILADEPTGALDRTTSTEIMELLRELSKDRLVVVITHDAKICTFADEIIHIQGGQIVPEQLTSERICRRNLWIGEKKEASLIAQARKNLKVWFARYLAAALTVPIGLLAFLFSLSFDGVIQREILAFQEKNTTLGSGYIRGTDDGTVLNDLQEDDRIQDAYCQYVLEDITLTIGEQSQQMQEKIPMPKATEDFSYGVMPRWGQNEIALSPSLAKKFESNIQNLPGKELTLELDGNVYTLTVSGIFNAGYDDFFVCSDVEQRLYQNIPDGAENYSISYDVGAFNDIVAVSNGLKLHGIQADTAAEEAAAFQNTFRQVRQLFRIISALILGIGIFLAAVLLFKLQNARYHEAGLLSALGYSRKQITGMFQMEGVLLSALSAGLNLVLLGGSMVIAAILGDPLVLSTGAAALSLAATFVVVLTLSSLASWKLIHTEPAEALRR